MKNSWTKEGMIHALLQNGKIVKITEGNLKNGKIVKITEGNLKNIDEIATGNVPVLDIEMSEVLAPPDNAERRTRLQQQQTRNAGLAASTPQQDSVFRSPHPSVPVRRKTSQADNSDNRSRNRGPPPRERRPHAAVRQPFSWDRWASPQGYTATAGGHRAPSPHILTAATGDQRASGMTGDHGHMGRLGTTGHHHLRAVLRPLWTTGHHHLWSVLRPLWTTGHHHLTAVLRPLGTAGVPLETAGHPHLTAV